MRQLILEGRGRGERFVLPEDRIDLDAARKLASQPLDDATGDQALFSDVTGGGQEYPERVQGRPTLLNAAAADNAAAAVAVP